MEALKNILECIRHKRHIPRDAAETMFDKPLPRATFEVLAAILNLSFTQSQLQDEHIRTIPLLQRLAESMGRITQLPKPCSFLANFSKDQFYDYCRSNREYQSLVNKVYGLFPPTNLLGAVPLLLEFDAGFSGGDDLGNPHWLLTRSVIEQWLGANRGQLSKEAALSCYILIASPRLLDATQGWGIWDCLWALLYIWLTRQFLSGPLKRAEGRASWCTLEGGQLRKMMLDAGSKASLPQERALFKLVLFAVDQLVGDGKGSDFLQQAAREYQSLPCQDWQDLLTLHLMKHVANAFLHNQLATQTEQIIVNAIQEITTITSLEFQYLLPNLLPESQVREYIIKRRLEFWNYGLDEEVCSDIAKLYLRDLAPFSDEQRGNVLAYLPLKYFVEDILTGLARQGLGKWGKLVVRTLLKSASRQAQILHRQLQLSQEECEQELKAFAQQWDMYYTLRLQGIDASNASACIAFLTFDCTLISECFRTKARFPQQSQQIYFEVLSLLTTHITNQNNIPLFMPLITDPIFVNYFEQLKEDSRDSFWKSWSGLMLQDDSILQALINIPVE